MLPELGVFVYLCICTVQYEYLRWEGILAYKKICFEPKEDCDHMIHGSEKIALKISAEITLSLVR